MINAYDKDIKNLINNIQNNNASFFITFTDKGLKNKMFEKVASVFELEPDNVKTRASNAIYKRSLNADNFTKANYHQLEKFLLSSDSISLKLNADNFLSPQPPALTPPALY